MIRALMEVQWGESVSVQGQLGTACAISLLSNSLNITTYSYYCCEVIEHM